MNRKVPNGKNIIVSMIIFLLCIFAGCMLGCKNENKPSYKEVNTKYNLQIIKKTNDTLTLSIN